MLTHKYSEFVNRMYGIFGTAAIDCIEEEELCTEFLTFDTPAIRVYREETDDEGVLYNGEFKWKKIANFASKYMQSFISIVNSGNYDSFVAREPNNYKCLVFGTKKSPSTLLKSLSKQYKDKLLFGYVRASETELLEKFDIKTFPTMLVLTEPEEYKGDIYTGPTEMIKLQDFFRPYAYILKGPEQATSKISKFVIQLLYIPS